MKEVGPWLVWMEWRPAGWSMFLPLLIFHCTIKVQKFSSGTGSPGWSRKKGSKMVAVVDTVMIIPYESSHQWCQEKILCRATSDKRGTWHNRAEDRHHRQHNLHGRNDHSRLPSNIESHPKLSTQPCTWNTDDCLHRQLNKYKQASQVTVTNRHTVSTSTHWHYALSALCCHSNKPVHRLQIHRIVCN